MAKQAAARPAAPDLPLEQALRLHQQGRFDEAGARYDAILSAHPEHVDALRLSGLVKYQQGRLADALRLVAAALKAKSDWPEALLDYGAILGALGRQQEALDTYDRVLAARPDDARLHYNRGNAQKHLGRYVEALASYDRAIALAPDLSVAYHNRGGTLAILDRNEEALASFERQLALAASPADRIEALLNRGKALARLKRYAAAIVSYDEALALHPDHAEALMFRGLVLVELGRHDEAIAHYEKSLALAPHLVDAHINRGNAFIATNRMAEALRSFCAAVALDPENGTANFNEALTRLTLGDFRCGWPKYEYRWKREEYAAARPIYPRPQWRGEKDIAGKTILLCAEQGLGDAIQFARYVPLLTALGAKVVLGVHRPLVALLETVAGVSQVVPDGQTLPHFDLYCSLLSLPLAFGTELASIPAKVPYLRADEARIAKWRGRIPDNGRLRIGVCWAGAGVHPNNRNRSIALEQFARLLTVSGLDFVSLQKDVSEADAAVLRAHGVAALGPEFEDLADTAAVMSMLDLVVAVDTSLAHLAGAMGKATAVLIPFSPDFRWMLDRTDSPWYPTLRLFRQSAIGDWDTPLDRLRSELEGVARRPARPR